MPFRNSGSLGLVIGAILLQAQALPPPPDDLPQGTGPRGTLQAVPGQDRYDAVGYAMVESAGDSTRIAVTSRKVSAGSFVEVTALDSGKTIAAIVAGEGPAAADRILCLSPAAAAALGVGASSAVPVRVRVIEPSQLDQAALRAGRAAGERLDTPKVLLTALRKRLPPPPAALSATASPARRAPMRRPVPAAPVPAPLAVSDDVSPSPPQPVTGASYAAPDAVLPAPAQQPAAPPIRQAVTRPTPQPRSNAAATAPAPGSLFVQIAALSDPSRASSLAGTVGGAVVTGGGLYRVRVGPYRDRRAADLARDALVRRGYADAHIVTSH